MLSRPAAVVNAWGSASILRCAPLMIFAQAGSPSGVRTSGRSAIRGLLLAGGTARAAETLDQIAIEILRFFLGYGFSGHGGLASEKQLRDIGERDGVATGHALAGKLFDEIAEEEIHCIGGCEAVDVAEKLGGEDLGVDSGNGRFQTADVVGAERRALSAVRGTMMLVDQHVTAVAFGAAVLAMGIYGGAD
jgi:hypothetical protein